MASGDASHPTEDAGHRAQRDLSKYVGSSLSDFAPSFLLPPPDCSQHRLCSTHKGSLLPYLETFHFLPLGQLPSDAMQYSQEEVDWLRSDKGPIPTLMCHFTGKLPQLHTQTAVKMFSPLEDQLATRKWGGEGRGMWSRRWAKTLAGVGRNCVSSYLLSGSWRQQSSCGRPAGSQMGVLQASGEAGRGSQWKAVALFWEAGEACSLSFLNKDKKTRRVLFTLLGKTDPSAGPLTSLRPAVRTRRPRHAPAHIAVLLTLSAARLLLLCYSSTPWMPSSRFSSQHMALSYFSIFSAHVFLTPLASRDPSSGFKSHQRLASS